MKWHVFATAGLPFSNSWALLILKRLMRASGVPKDVLFSHFIKLNSFLTVVTNMILADKNFWVVLMTLDCLQSATLKKKIRFYLILRTGSDWTSFIFYMKFCFHLLKQFFQFTLFHLMDASMACMLWFLRLLGMTCFKWFIPNSLFQFNPVAVWLISEMERWSQSSEQWLGIFKP